MVLYLLPFGFFKWLVAITLLFCLSRADKSICGGGGFGITASSEIVRLLLSKIKTLKMVNIVAN